MKAFRATHIKLEMVEGTAGAGCVEKKETVLIIKILAQERGFLSLAVFVRSDGTIGEAAISQFKGCEPDWRG